MDTLVEKKKKLNCDMLELWFARLYLIIHDKSQNTEGKKTLRVIDMEATMEMKEWGIKKNLPILFLFC